MIDLTEGGVPEFIQKDGPAPDSRPRAPTPRANERERFESSTPLHETSALLHPRDLLAISDPVTPPPPPLTLAKSLATSRFVDIYNQPERRPDQLYALMTTERH